MVDIRLGRSAGDALLEHVRLLFNPRWKPLPHQSPPPGDWYGWILLAGRMAGKTDACAHYVHNHVNGPPCLPGSVPHWIGIIGPTQGDAVTSCFKGPSGLRVHSPDSRLVNTDGGTVVRWPNGSEAKIFGAHSPEDVERLRSGGNRCIMQGTLVRAERGLVPIENVAVGDRVWTRNGLRRVMAVWDNGVKDVRRYDHAAGSTWMTPDHKVWTRSGWKLASSVMTDDTVFTWEYTGSPSSTTVSAGVLAGTVTTRTGTGACFTGTCTPGRSGQYPTGCTCITKTTTSRTIDQITSFFCEPASIGSSTTRSGELTGIARVAVLPGIGRCTGNSSVNGAARSSSHVAQPVWFGTAQTVVGTLRHDHGSSGCVACAVASSSVSHRTRRVPVHESALRAWSQRSRKARVYDLTVEHDHEFFAGDLLVSNCLVWAEEMAAWRHLDDAWDHMRFGLRVGPRPHWVASTTPKPKPLIKKLNEGVVERVVLTRASYKDNPYILPEIKESLEDAYGGTQLGRQELYGEVIDQDENALWTREVIDEHRVRPGDVPSLARISVGIDPSGGQGEQGIVVAGKSKPFALPGQTRLQAHGYVLDDRSCRLSPAGWGRRAVQAAIDWEADEIFAEINYGGDMCVSTVRAACEDLGVNIPVRMVRATRGKAIRAQPVSALTVQGRWHHAGTFPELETQMTTWYPELDWSPDRLDSSIWTAWGLKLVHTSPSGKGSLGSSAANRVITA